jgi:hypothetical protein
MTGTTFYIVMNIKTGSGFESIAKFFIGNKKELAKAVFGQLKGNKNADETSILTLDLMETVNSLPVNMDVLSCSLEEMAANCKIIVKETFKIINLKEI